MFGGDGASIVSNGCRMGGPSTTVYRSNSELRTWGEVGKDGVENLGFSRAVEFASRVEGDRREPCDRCIR